MKGRFLSGGHRRWPSRRKIPNCLHKRGQDLENIPAITLATRKYPPWRLPYVAHTTAASLVKTNLTSSRVSQGTQAECEVWATGKPSNDRKNSERYPRSGSQQLEGNTYWSGHTARKVVICVFISLRYRCLKYVTHELGDGRLWVYACLSPCNDKAITRASSMFKLSFPTIND